MLKNLFNLETLDDSSKKIVFIHIPKTGGTSIYNLFNSSKYKFKYYNHDAFKNKNLIENETGIKFTIVRNPYARLVSAYHYLKDGGKKNELDLGYQKKLEKYNSFNEFVDNLDNNIIYDILHFVPQHEYLVFNNKLLINNILYLENINNDIDMFCKKYSLDKINMLNINKSKHNKFEEYIQNQNIRDKIYKLYEKDFDLLKYNY